MLVIGLAGLIFLLCIILFGTSHSEPRVYASPLDENRLCNNILPISNVTASGSKEGFSYSYAIDNNSNTRWANKGIGSWLQLDLGKGQNICSIDLTWYNGTTRVYNFVLATSTNGNTFTDVLNNKNVKTQSVEKITPNSTARYIRLTVNGNNESDYASLSDVKVYGLDKSSAYEKPKVPPSMSKPRLTNTNLSNILFPTINVATDRIKYVEGQSLTIFGSAINQWGKPLNAPLTVKVQQYVEDLTSNDNVTSKGNLTSNGTLKSNITSKNIKPASEKKFSLFTVYSATLIPNGTYSIILNKGLMPGHYNITSYIPHASAKAFNISNIGTLSTTLISVEKWYLSTPFLILFLGGFIGISGLSYCIISTPSKTNTLLEFIFLSVIAFTPIATFALTDVALFPDSPVGIIIKPNVVVKSENVTQSVGEWMINVGGTSSDKYKAGIQIPVAIFIFGIAGGYLRYLYSKAHPISTRTNAQPAPVAAQPALPNLAALRLALPAARLPEPLPIDARFSAILQNLILLFLSPLLAIAVWLVLFQGGTTSPLTLAAVSFGVGLATKQATRGLISFVEKIFSPNPKSADQNGN